MAFGLLKGKKGIIFGALNDMSIAWKVAERVHEEGGSFTLTNTPVALRLGTLGELAERTGSEIISADATSRGDVEKVVTRSMEILGGKVDFILHSIGMSPNVRKGYTYDNLNYDYFYIKRKRDSYMAPIIPADLSTGNYSIEQIAIIQTLLLITHIKSYNSVCLCALF